MLRWLGSFDLWFRIFSTGIKWWKFFFNSGFWVNEQRCVRTTVYHFRQTCLFILLLKSYSYTAKKKPLAEVMITLLAGGGADVTQISQIREKFHSVIDSSHGKCNTLILNHQKYHWLSVILNFDFLIFFYLCLLVLFLTPFTSRVWRLKAFRSWREGIALLPKCMHIKGASWKRAIFPAWLLCCPIDDIQYTCSNKGSGAGLTWIKLNSFS